MSRALDTSQAQFPPVGTDFPTWLCTQTQAHPLRVQRRHEGPDTFGRYGSHPRKPTMFTTTRRIFLLQIAATSTAALAATPVPPAGPAMVNEKDSTASALGYVADTSKADQKKFPQHAAAQKCSACALYQGKAGDAAGACPIFAGKQVAASGWCSSFVKKTA